MNKLKKFLLRSLKVSLLFCCSLFLFSACSRLISYNILVSDNSQLLGSGFVTLRATILNYNEVTSDELISESSPSARSINPEMASQNYAFYLYGQKSYDMQNIEIGPSKINQISETTGEFSMDIPKGIWILTLVALKDEAGLDLSNLTKIKQQALLWGSTVCDYTNDSSPISFLLTPDGLSTKGSVNIDLELADWTVSDHIGVANDNLEKIKVKAGIYRYNKSGAERIVAEEEVTFINDGSKDKCTFAPKDKTDSTKALEINPGSYEFVVSFYEDIQYTDPESGETLTYIIRQWTWSDQINIFPGRETETKVSIPRLISEPPAAPSNFVISHYDTNYENFISTDGLYYACIFEWQDNSETETGFEIRLNDIDEDGFSKTYNYEISINNKNLCIGGNLGPITGKGNKGKLVARVRLGHRIKAEIRAISETIGSDWIEGELIQSPSEGVAFKRLSSDSNDALYNVMNMYKVTYQFNGGKNSEAITLNNIGSIAINDLNDIYTFYGPNENLNHISISTTNNENKKLFKIFDSETRYFNFWAENPVSSKAFSGNPFDSSNYQNIELWAQYVYIAPSGGTTQQQQDKLESRMQKNMTINGTKPKPKDFAKDSTSLNFTLGTTITVILNNNVSITGGLDTYKYEYLRVVVKDNNGEIKASVYGENEDNGAFLWATSKIEVKIPLTADNGFVSGQTYSMVLQARPENSTDIITTTLYFKIN